MSTEANKGNRDFRPGQKISCRVKSHVAHLNGYFVEIENVGGAFLDTVRVLKRDEVLSASFLGVSNGVIMLADYAVGPDDISPPNDPFDPLNPSRVPKHPYPIRGDTTFSVEEPDAEDFEP
jgi:hypothetical protein